METLLSSSERPPTACREASKRVRSEATWGRKLIAMCCSLGQYLASPQAQRPESQGPTAEDALRLREAATKGGGIHLRRATHIGRGDIL